MDAFRSLLAAACVLVAALGPTPARAQFVCGGGPEPGMRQVGTHPGGNGVAPTPLCVWDNDGKAATTEQPADADPTKDARQAMTASVDAQQAAVSDIARRMKALADSPEHKRLSAGYWQYFQDPPTDTQPAGCTALFASLDGMLTLTSRGGADKPVMVRFVGDQIPAPAKVSNVSISLRDGGKPPQPMPALNVADPFSGMGSFGIAVRDLPGALGVFQESGDFAIDLDGRRTYALKYRGGAQMKQRFGACALGKQ